MESSRTFRVIGATRVPKHDAGPGRPWLPDLKVLVTGFVLAQVFVFKGCSWVAWFLSSLVHEVGHTIAGLLVGLPSFPAIRLDGHAATIHGEFSATYALLAAAALLGCAFHLFQNTSWRRAAIALAAVVPFQLALAFCGRETFCLLAGHLGELAFAVVFLVRALDHGEEDGTAIGRLLEATFAMYLVCHNATLFFGLATSAQAVHAYAGNGSFGLENDLLRVAGGSVGAPLTRVAVLMLLPTLAAPFVAVAIARLRR